MSVYRLKTILIVSFLLSLIAGVAWADGSKKTENSVIETQTIVEMRVEGAAGDNPGGKARIQALADRLDKALKPIQTCYASGLYRGAVPEKALRLRLSLPKGKGVRIKVTQGWGNKHRRLLNCIKRNLRRLSYRKIARPNAAFLQFDLQSSAKVNYQE